MFIIFFLFLRPLKKKKKKNLNIILSEIFFFTTGPRPICFLCIFETIITVNRPLNFFIWRWQLKCNNVKDSVAFWVFRLIEDSVFTKFRAAFRILSCSNSNGLQRLNFKCYRLSHKNHIEKHRQNIIPCLKD